MSRLSAVSISNIDANPFRRLGDYPYVVRKIEALKQSIQDVGLWEGVIAREVGNRYQIAFGHHRIEAARQLGKNKVWLILRNLNDKEMLQFMGRENMEDYNAEFLVMLETWEAGVSFPHHGAEKRQGIDTAVLLGWIRRELDSKTGVRMTPTAQACNAAHALITGGYLGRDDLVGLSVNAALEICTRAQARIEQMRRIAASTKRPHAEIVAGKQHVGKGAKATIKRVKDGTILQRNLRGSVDAEAAASAHYSKAAPSPLFAVFGRAFESN